MASLRSANLVVGEKLRLDNMYFEADSSGIQDKSLDALEDVFTFLEENNTLVIEIGGHTDVSGEDDYNLKLSKERAKSVLDFFVASGISSDRLTHIGYGESKPLTSEKGNEASAINRRIELLVTGI